jgi:hypothetical protein
VSNRGNYPRLSVEEFGKVLIESNDLDPIYVALYTMLESDVLSHAQLNRWMLAYSCLYHAGLASYLSEQEGAKFFKALDKAAKNLEPSPIGGRWPRGHERRHWRGIQAQKSCDELFTRYGKKPEDCLDYIRWGNDGPVTWAASFADISGRVREHRGFGGWIAFKLADMIDRLGLRQVEFKYNDVIIYDDPLIAAEMVARQRLNLPANARVKPDVVRDVFSYLEEHFNSHLAPPLYDRPISLQEVESILCKYKSSLNGHYPPYNDIKEIRAGLKPWAEVSEVASYFLASMPRVPEAVDAKAA